MARRREIAACLPRWVLEHRKDVEDLAELYRLAGRLTPEEFAAREEAFRRQLLRRLRALTRKVEYAAGIHSAAPESERVVPFRKPPRRRRRELEAILCGPAPDPGPRAA